MKNTAETIKLVHKSLGNLNSVSTSLLIQKGCDARGDLGRWEPSEFVAISTNGLQKI